MFSIIKFNRDEFREGNVGVRTFKTSFLGIPIFSGRVTSTNNAVVQQLTPATEKRKTCIIGFKTNKDEVKSTNKKNK